MLSLPMTAFGGAEYVLLHTFEKVDRQVRVSKSWDKDQCTFKVGGGNVSLPLSSLGQNKKNAEGVQLTNFFFTTHTNQPFTMSDWGA